MTQDHADKAMHDMDNHADGIYIGLPEDEYHADTAIGGSGFKVFYAEPTEYWWQSPFNPDYDPPEKSGAVDLGSAVHAMLLEGRKAYEERYFSKTFDPDVYPDTPNTVDDLKDVCRARGLKVGGKKELLVQRLLEDGYDGQFMWDLREDFDAEHLGKTYISSKWYNRLALFVMMRERDPALRDLFSEGLPEVSVFWTDNGIRYRARFDWLRADTTWDVKTYAGRTGNLRREDMLKAIMSYRYDLQMVHYRAARAAMQSLPVFGGDDLQRSYVDKCKSNGVADFRFLFAKTVGAPQISRCNADVLIGAAEYEYDRAKEQLAAMVEHFGGMDTPWLTTSDEYEVELTDVPAWFGAMTGLAA